MVGPGSDDQTLHARALDGDEAAWNALVRRHNRRVVVSLLAMGMPIDQAKELAQEAWLRLLRQQREGKLTRLVLPALAVRQARFLALDMRRRGRGEALPIEAAEEAADGHPSAEQQLLSREELRRAQRVLSRCGTTAQQIFRRVYGPRGLNARQAADELGISHQRAKQSLSEVRARMRRALEKDHG